MMMGSSRRGHPSSYSLQQLSRDRVFSVFPMRGPETGFTVLSGEKLVSRSANGSGIHTCLLHRKVSDQKAVYKESIPSTNGPHPQASGAAKTSTLFGASHCNFSFQRSIHAGFPMVDLGAYMKIAC